MTHAAIHEFNTERRAFDDAVTLYTIEVEREAIYYAALDWVRLVDSQLECGYHLRDCGGRLLVTLDEVTRAAEAGRLMETKKPHLRGLEVINPVLD